MAASTPEFHIEPLTNQGSLTDRVTEALSQMIRGGEFPPKSRLPTETEMGNRFGVSRTVIREAVSRLKSESLVESRQGVGVFVRDRGLDTPFRIDPNVVESMRSVLQIAELRRGLEAEMAALAAERRSADQLGEIRMRLKALDKVAPLSAEGVDADMAFHREIARATDNPHFVALWDFIGQFLRGAMTVTRANEARSTEYTAQVRAEHDALVDAIARGDAEAARAAARLHMEMAAVRIKSADADFWGTEEGKAARRIAGAQVGSETT
ncbi:FadR/GntR family transcriptional regulator [Aromatoleum diolicum]|uniref:FCD domain-containing protein n=1 Tax=Aromatoleum diolicum TaxID=75796 RepID=A0ABX1Q8Y0_9RHOO|nr:FCD domain-containing protein [Aromatoleum diolicum]NMG73634.1 FCD domain-containing protein [Aromatoleum diolicum]